jgi:hypothetical protein
VLAHLIQGEQTFVFDGFADRAFFHAIAAAHLGIVGHAGGFAVAFMAHVTNVRFTKHQLLANVGHAAPIAQQLEVPAAVHGVAVQTRAHQLVVADDEFFVHAFVRVAQHNLFSAAVIASHEVARAEQINAGDFELGRGERAGVAANAELGQMVGQHFALLKQRCHQTIGNATVGRAFAHGINAWVCHGLQRVTHDNAALTMQVHFFGQCCVGANAHGHHHQLGGHMRAVFEQDRCHTAVFVGLQFLGVCLHAELHAALFERALQQAACHFVELTLHQPFTDVHHGHAHAAFHQTVGCFEAEQTAANHHRVFVCRGRINHGLCVGDVAVGQHAL